MHHPPITRAPFDVQPERVFLLEVNIRTTGIALAEREIKEGDIEEGDVGVLLTLARPADRTLLVLITLTFENSRWYEGTTTYGAEFRMAEHVPPEEMESTWRYVASELAPITLYPFLREVLLNVTSRTLAPKLVLPFAPLPLDMSSLDIPTTSAEQRVMRFEASGKFGRGGESRKKKDDSEKKGASSNPGNTPGAARAGTGKAGTGRIGSPRQRAAGTTKQAKEK